MKVTKRAKLKPLNSVRLADNTVKDQFGRLMVITYKDVEGKYHQRRYLSYRDKLNHQKFKTLTVK
jgi:hypothetical protein